MMIDKMSELIKELYGTNPNEAIRTEITDIRCAHPPKEMTFSVGQTLVDEVTIYYKIVELKQYTDDKRRLIGWLGQCPSCNKVYYKY